MPKVVAEYIDRVISTELRPNGTLPRGVAHQLYDAARRRTGDPLTYAMATRLIDTVHPGDRVVIVTGAGGPPNMPAGEIDGLLGSVALARALLMGLQADVNIVVERRFLEPLKAIAWAGELNVEPAGETWPESIKVHEAPVDDAAAEQFSARILDELRPVAVLAIEKLSVNHLGVMHGVTGLPWNDVHFNARWLFEESSRRGVFTGGIGDGGNEIGWGGIPEVRDIMPAGSICQCPCAGGIAAAVGVDIMVHGAISNWGAYGVVGMLAYLLRRPDLLAEADYVEGILRAAVNSGVVCGWYSRPRLSDDGVPLSAQRALAELVSTAVRQGLMEYLPSSSH